MRLHEYYKMIVRFIVVEYVLLHDSYFLMKEGIHE